ncbi:MAG: cellulase family glycosylhydrolase [Verrucomicrobiota bacterium]
MKKLFFSLFAGTAMLATQAQAEPIQITADPGAPLCTNFLGFGVQWSAYPWFDLTDAAWQKIFERLDYMRVPIVRLMTRSYTYCDGFDADGKPIYNWDNSRMKKMYRLLDYCQAHGVKVILGEWDHPSSQQDRPDIATDKLQQYHMDENDPRWHRIIADEVEYLRNVKHYTCIVYFNLLNEPNSNSSGRIPFDKWKSAITSLNAEFAKRGLAKDVKMVGPDVTFLPRDGFWIELNVQQCPKEVAAYDFHYYAPAADLESGYLEKFCWMKKNYIDRYDPSGKAKPFFMGEAGMTGGPVQPQGGSDSQPHIYGHNYGVWMADYNVQCARAGMAGTIAWNLDDAMHINKDKDSKWPDVTKTFFKKWGFWNSLASEIGHPEDMNLRPWFFTWSLLSRSFPPGCTTLKTSETLAPGLRTLAATVGNDLSIALVNDSDSPQEIHVRVLGGKKIPQLARYNYFPDEKLTDKNGFPQAKEILADADLAAGLKVSLPARSVVIFTSVK